MSSTTENEEISAVNDHHLLEEIKEIVTSVEKTIVSNGEKGTTEAVTVGAEKEVVENRPVKQVNFDEYKNTKMHHAAAAGNMDDIRLEIELGYGIDRKNFLGWTPLMIATRKGYLEVVKLLLEKRADATQKNDFGSTVFQMAIASGNLDIVVILLQHLLTGGVSRQSMESTLSPMSLAILYNHEHILSYLLGNSFNSNATTPKTGLTPLMFAAISTNKKFFHTLILNGVDIKPVNFNRQTAGDLLLMREQNTTFLPRTHNNTTVLPTQQPPQQLQSQPSQQLQQQSQQLQQQHYIPQQQRHNSVTSSHPSTPHETITTPQIPTVIFVSPQPSYYPDSPHVTFCHQRKSSNISVSPAFIYRNGNPITPITFFPPQQVFFPVEFDGGSPMINGNLHGMYAANDVFNKGFFGEQNAGISPITTGYYNYHHQHEGYLNTQYLQYTE